jgi:hypothetical protein
VAIIFITEATNIGHRHYFSGLWGKELEIEIAKNNLDNLAKAKLSNWPAQELIAGVSLNSSS